MAALTGRSVGDAIRPADVATVRAHERGGLKHVPDGAAVVPLLNVVDDDALRETATEAAGALLSRSDRVERAVLARLLADDPVVAVRE